jgi:hypothetical protein
MEHSEICGIFKDFWIYFLKNLFVYNYLFYLTIWRILSYLKSVFFLLTVYEIFVCVFEYFKYSINVYLPFLKYRPSKINIYQYPISFLAIILYYFFLCMFFLVFFASFLVFFTRHIIIYQASDLNFKSAKSKGKKSRYNISKEVKANLLTQKELTSLRYFFATADASRFTAFSSNTKHK